jgi:hypothetical protein
MTYSFTDGGDGSLHVSVDGSFSFSIHGSEVSVVKNTAQSVVELSDSEHVFVAINVNQVSGASTLQDIVDAIESALPNDSDGGGAGTLDATLSAGNSTARSAIFDDGGGGVNTISPASVLITDGTNITTVQGGAVITDNGAGITSTLSSGSLTLTDGVDATTLTPSRITSVTMTLSGLANYADNAAAIVGGLTAGDLYYTNTLGTATLKIVI